MFGTLLSVVLSVIVFLPIAASPAPAESAQAGGVDFSVTVCETADSCGDPVPAGLTLHVTNEAHPGVPSVPGGAHEPYGAQFAVPVDGRVFVNDVTGGLFDVYVVDADGNAGLIVNPLVSSDENYVLSFNAMMPAD